MNENNLNIEQTVDIDNQEENYFQVDLLKAFMIAFVVLDHALGYTNKWGLGLELWERMSIPIFLIIMGFNMGNSFKRGNQTTLKELYSWDYFKKKFWRFVFPYLIFYFVSTTIGFLLYGASFPYTLYEDWDFFLNYIIFQRSLLEGPGNWFIPILFQSIFLIPLLYWCFSKWPKASLIACFAIEIAMHLFIFAYVGPIYSIDDWLTEIYFRLIIFVYISAIGMGIWFSQDHELFSKKNLFVWILFPFCLIYMIAWDFFSFRLEINDSGIVRGDYNYLTFLYAALIFLIILRIVPKNPKNMIAKGFSAMSRATFHIYLVQDIFYITLYIIYIDIWGAPGFSGLVNVLGIVSSDFATNFGLFCLNWIICISIGGLWWYGEKKLLTLIKRK